MNATLQVSIICNGIEIAKVTDGDTCNEILEIMRKRLYRETMTVEQKRAYEAECSREDRDGK